MEVTTGVLPTACSGWGLRCGGKRPVGPKTTGGRPHLGYATERATATLWKTMGRAIFLARPSVSAPI